MPAIAASKMPKSSGTPAELDRLYSWPIRTTPPTMVLMAKIDPRVDPVTNPPAKGAENAHSIEHVSLLKAVVIAPHVAVDPGEASAETANAPNSASTVTSTDPRHEPIEKLLDANDWRGVADNLGPIEQAGNLPANLGLVAAIAYNELAHEGSPEAVAIAIRCTAAILGTAETSPLARVLARRMLRKNPVRLRDRPAPPARVSLLIVVATLAIGGGIGWLASMGGWDAIARWLHL